MSFVSSLLRGDVSRVSSAAVLSLLALTLLACGGPGVALRERPPRWACPSPVPLAYGPTGPVKELIRHTRPLSEGGDFDEPVYYAQWEQEYGPGGSLLGADPPHAGPPFPAPTPYALQGTTYALGQRIEVAPLHVQVSLGQHEPRGDQQLTWLRLTWHNPTANALPVDYLRQLAVGTVRTPGGALRSGDGWRVTHAALAAAGLDRLPTSIPPGESSIVVPVITPAGSVTDVALSLDAPGRATPVPGAAQSAQTMTVHWVADPLTIGPPCADPGALTDWDGAGWGRPAPIDLPVPAGGGRLVTLVLAQRGKPYVWGANGPESFDCSGLVVWAYGQVGIGGLPRSTFGQFPALPPVAPGAARIGDLAYFDTATPPEIAPPQRANHVGVLVGDVTGDGRMDMVHAASPELGVQLVSDVFHAPYYGLRLIGVRSVPGWVPEGSQ